MPKIFSDDDRETIRKSLMKAGREHFLRYGIRRTKIEELAAEAGIAKGTFYNFFESKEDLCLTIYDLEELAMRKETEEILRNVDDPEETLVALMDYSLRFVRGDSLLTRLRESGEYRLLVRGVGRERLSEHLDNDLEFAREVVEELQRKGAACRTEPKVIAGVLRAFVMLTFHENEIGKDIFTAVMGRLARWIAKGLIEGDTSNERSSE